MEGDSRPLQAVRRHLAALRAILPLLLCFCFSGCLVGPDFSTPPTPPLPLDFLAKQSQIEAPSMPLDQWWNSLGDGTLNELLNQAQSQNLTLREAYQRIVEARSNYRLQGGQLLPNGDAVGGYSFNKRSPNSRPFVGQNGEPFDLLSLGLQTSWEIDLFGRIGRQIEAAEAEVQFQEFDFETIRQTLFADIVASYLQIRLLQSQLALLEQNMLIQSHTAELVMKRTEAGVSTELDKSQTDSFGFRTRTRYVALNQQLELEFNNLSLLMGQTPNMSLQDYVGIRPLPSIPAIPAAGLPADLIRRRPDVRRQEMQIKAASALIGVAESDLYPRLTLIGNVGVSSQALSGLFETDGLEFDVGPSFAWNILHFGRICDNIDIHKARFEQSVAAWQQSILVAVREVEDAMVNYNGFVEQQHEIEKAIVADEDAVELSLDRYKAGKANFQRVIDAQQQLLDDQQQKYQFQAEAMIQLVRLFRATGGDWTIDSHSIESCGTCVSAAPMVTQGPVMVEMPNAAPSANSAFDTPMVLEMPTYQMPTYQMPTYPLQQSIDPATLSAAESPFSPNDNQSVFIQPPPAIATPLNNVRGIPTPTQPRSIPSTSETFLPPTSTAPQPSAESWLWE